MLDDEERALSAALSTMARSVPEDASSAAAQEVAALLRRLGHGSSVALDHDRPDGVTDPADARRTG